MSAGSATAQDIFGRITGTVTDPAGATIPNAVVSVTNQATKVTRTVKADSQGFYVATELPAVRMTFLRKGRASRVPRVPATM
jgi:Carboxypeptidase regulatory-like domain